MLESIASYINENYGSKRGLINHLYHLSCYRAGLYANLQGVQWSQVKRLIFVCAGNICRSPLAAACVVGAGVQADSFGISGGDGFAADPRAIRFAASQGIDLKPHIAKNIKNYLPCPGDLVIGMEPDHIHFLKEVLNGAGVQLTLAGLWLSQPKAYIHDPYSASDDFFEKCELEIIESARNIAHHTAHVGVEN